MQLQLYRGFGSGPSERLFSKEASWSDLQCGARVVWTADGQPVRHIAPRSRLPVGRYNSRKAGRLLHHQSRGHGHVGGEKLALMRCEIDPSVVDFRSQHIRFDLLLQGTTQAYFPDIITLMHDGSIVVIEVKKDCRWKSDLIYRAKIDTVREICGDLGWYFEVWTQDTMAPTPRVRDNITQVQMQRFIAIDEVQILTVARAFQANDGCLTVGQIKGTLGGLPGAGDLARGLMCRGILELPLEGLIGDDTVATRFTRSASPRLEHAA